jgi:methylase of polypeptide subunit release factors
MNQIVSNTFGEYYGRLPLRKSATIKHGNAVRTDWQSLIDPLPFEKGQPKYDYILGNPPFIGKSLINAAQKEDMDVIFNGVNGAGVLDYVTAGILKQRSACRNTILWTRQRIHRLNSHCVALLYGCL